jgi:hypothetical protein
LYRESGFFSPSKLLSANLGLNDQSLLACFVRQDVPPAKEARLQFGHLPTVSSVGSANSPYAIPKKQQDGILRQATVELNPSEIKNP